MWGRFGKPVADANRDPSVVEILRSGNAPLNCWGALCLLMYLLTQVANPFVGGTYVRFPVMLMGAAFAVSAMLFLRSGLKIILPIGLLLLLQAWAFVSYIYGFSVTARSDEWGKQLFFLVEDMMPYFVAYMLCELNPHWRKKMIAGILIVLTLSAIAALGEFFKLPGFKQVYDFYIWDKALLLEKEVRASGLADHPNIFGLQMVVALSILGSRLIDRGLKTHEFFLAALFSLTLVMAQGRTMYIAGMLIVFFVLITLAKNAWMQAIGSLTVIVVLVVVAATLLPDQFGYAFSKKDAALTTLNDRQAVWHQYMPIIERFPYTGIGPDEVVFQGGGSYGHYAIGLMENAYLLMLTMLGIPGLVLFIAALVSSLWGCVRLYASKFTSMEVKRYAYIGIGSSVGFMIACTTGNFVDGSIPSHLLFLIAGVVASSYYRPLGSAAAGVSRRSGLV